MQNECFGVAEMKTEYLFTVLFLLIVPLLKAKLANDEVSIVLSDKSIQLKGVPTENSDGTFNQFQVQNAVVATSLGTDASFIVFILECGNADPNQPKSYRWLT